jgi:hypothetical protein
VGWLERLQRWITGLFHPKKKRRAYPKIIKRWYGQHCAVLRIERSTPGGIATYRITSPYGSCDYLITLDYLPELYAEILGKFQGTAIKIPKDSSPHTHRFAVWRVFPNGSSNPVGVWDVDLEGFAQNLNRRQLASRYAVAGVALKPLGMIYSRKNPSFSWQSQMERMDWLALLEERIRGELSNPQHNLKACVILQEGL